MDLEKRRRCGTLTHEVRDGRVREIQSEMDIENSVWTYPAVPCSLPGDSTYPIADPIQTVLEGNALWAQSHPRRNCNHPDILAAEDGRIRVLGSVDRL